MNNEYLRILGRGLVLALFTAMFVYIFMSCSSSRRAVRHYEKAVKFGYVCNSVSDTIQIRYIDSIPFAKNDTIYWLRVERTKDTVIMYKNSSFPVDRFITKYKYLERKQEEKTKQAAEKTAQVEAKAENKNRGSWKFLLGLFIALMIVVFFMSRIKI